MSGPRIRYKDKDFDLDITPITPRVYAMSYPAADFFQKMYRNPIQDVASFIEQKHGEKFWIYNLSGRVYDKKPFKGRVNDYEWEDHHSPTMVLLVEACQSIFKFLEQDPDNVIYVHCNAGKGRTGTLICCYLMFCGFADSAQNAITYYGWKRFRHGRGVTQPSQLRYVFYFEKILSQTVTCPKRVRLKYLVIENLPKIKNTFRLQAQFFDAHEYKHLHQNPERDIIERLAGDSIYLSFKKENVIFSGNIFVKIMHLSRSGSHKMICRFAFHTSFLSKLSKEQRLIQLADDDQDEQQFHCSMDQLLVCPNAIAKDQGYAGFKIKMIFTEACQDEACASKAEPGSSAFGLSSSPSVEDTSQIVEQNLKFLNLSNKPQRDSKLDNLCKNCVTADPVEYKEWTIINKILEERRAWINEQPDVGGDHAAGEFEKQMKPQKLKEHKIGVR